jgi:hypothetical protein
MRRWHGLRRNLPAAPTLKHPERDEEAEGGPVTVVEGAPLDLNAPVCKGDLAPAADAGLALAGPIVPTGAPPEDTSSTPTMARITATPLMLPILSRSANQANRIPGARLPVYR